MKFFTRIILLVILLSGGIGLCCNLMASRVLHNVMETKFKEKAEIIVQLTAEHITHNVINNEVIFAKKALEKIISSNMSVDYAYIIGFDNEIFAHSFENEFLKDFSEYVFEVINADEEHISRYSTSKGPVFDIGYPLINGMPACIHIGMNESRAHNQIAAFRNRISILTLSITLLGVLLGAFMARRITYPLGRFADLMHAFGKEKAEEKIDFTGGGHEIKELTLAFNHMIYERIKVEKALRESEKNLSLTLNSIGDGVIATDTKGRVKRMNPIAEKLTGWSLSEAEGRPLIEVFNIINEKTRKRVENPVEKVMRKGVIVGMANHTALISKNGAEIPIADSAAPIIDDQGDIAGIVLVFRDVSEKMETEKKKGEIEAEAIRLGQLTSLGEIAAGVAHEINNPINSVINLAQILLNESNPESLEHDIAGRIVKEGDRIADIVSNLLSFARGNGKTEKSPVNLSEIISDTLILAKAQIRKKQIKLRVDIPLNLPKIIANPQQIQQVFLNLIINAQYALNQKYSGANKNKIFEILSEELTIDEYPYVRIIFQDRGTGIPANEIKKVMNPFYSTKPGGKGTGLGLSISHGIITDHDGYIRIESTEGEFTRVIIDLPASGKEKGI